MDGNVRLQFIDKLPSAFPAFQCVGAVDAVSEFRHGHRADRMLSLPQSRWIGEAENLQNETLVFLIRKTRHVNDDLCGGLLAGRAENPGHAWRNHWASLAR